MSITSATYAHATRSTLPTFNPQIAAFRFDEQVVEVFDDMIERRFRLSHHSSDADPTGRTLCHPQSHIYDLGCSLARAPQPFTGY